MIHSQVRFLENRCQFELIRSTFIVTGFCRNAQPMALVFEFIHKSIYPLGNSPEIMIFQLLIFSCRMAHQSTAAQFQVRPGIEQGFVDQKIFLFPSQGCRHFFHIFIEILANADSCLVDQRQGLQHRRFIIQGFARISHEYRRYTQGVVVDESRRSRIPGGISSGFKSIPDTAVRKTRCIGLLLYQHPAVEGFYHTSVFLQIDKPIVFFCRSSVQGMKPVSVMGCSLFYSPGFHRCSNLIGQSPVYRPTFYHHLFQFLESFYRQILTHFLYGKYITSENFRYPSPFWDF